MEWIQSHPALWTAAIAAISAIAGALIAAGARFAFDFYLSERIKRRWRTIDTKRKYSVQIIRVADELSGRLGNLARHMDDGKTTLWLRPLKSPERRTVPFDRYYFSSTVYLIAQLIAWIEVLKREQIFLDFATVKETRQFNSYLELMYSILSHSGLTNGGSDPTSKNYWIYYHYLSGIGQLLFLTDDDAKGLRCMTFHEFCSNYRSGEKIFTRCIREVECLVVNLSNKNGDVRWKRLQMLRLCLDQFLNFADPNRLHATRFRMQPNETSDEISSAVEKQARYYGLKIRRSS